MVMVEDELDELSGLLALGAYFRFACTAVAYGVVGSLDRLLLALGAVHRCQEEEEVVRNGVRWSFQQQQQVGVVPALGCGERLVLAVLLLPLNDIVAPRAQTFVGQPDRSSTANKSIFEKEVKIK